MSDISVSVLKHEGEVAVVCKCGSSSTSMWVAKNKKSWNLRCNLCSNLCLGKTSLEDIPEVVYFLGQAKMIPSAVNFVVKMDDTKTAKPA